LVTHAGREPPLSFNAPPHRQHRGWVKSSATALHLLCCAPIGREFLVPGRAAICCAPAIYHFPL